MVDTPGSGDLVPASASHPPRRRSIPLVRKLIYGVVVCGVLLGIPELMVRLLWKPPVPRTPAVGTRQFVNWLSRLSDGERTEKPLYRPDSKLLWRLEPGITIQSFNHHFAPGGEKQSIQLSINQDGYRGQSINSDTRQSIARVLCLGDSNFFGYPLDDSDAFPSVLERTLCSRCPQKKWEVINGGVPGYTVVQGWRWYQETFQQHSFDWLLLSFLNNDAWRQPQQDLDLLDRNASLVQPLGDLARRSRLVNWAEFLLRPELPKSQYVPRVTRADFIAHYRLLIDAARRGGMRVMILDFRAYEQYEPYSEALREFAEQEHVVYVSVGTRMADAIADPSTRKPFPEQALRIERRWGTDLLTERPYLWYFAEFRPEHLSELGVALLSNQLTESLCQEHK